MKRISVMIVLLFWITTAFALAGSSLSSAWDQTWRGDYKAAVKGYRDFIKTHPDDPLTPVAMFNLASLNFQQLSDLKAARKGFIELAGKYPDSKWTTEAYRLLAQISLRQKKNEEASEYFRLALKGAQNETYAMPDHWVSGLIDEWQTYLSEQQDKQLAIEAYRDIIPKLPPGDSVARAKYNLARAQKDLNQPEAAARTLTEVLYAYPASTWAGRILQQDRSWVSETIDFPWEAVEKYQQANAAGRQGQFERAQGLYQELVTSETNASLVENAQFGLIVMNSYLTGDFVAALSAMQNYLTRYPHGVRSRDAARRREVWEDVVRLQELVKEDPEDYGAWAQLGFVLLQNRYLSQATAPLLVAAKDTTDDRVLLGLGQAYLASPQVDQGIAYLERYLQKHPDQGDLFNQVGYAYLQVGQGEKALSCFARYRDLDPTNANAHDSYGECLIALERLEDAIASYQKALEINPSFSNPYFMLGEIYRQQGEKDEAVTYYTKYLELDSNGFQSAAARENLELLKP